jgi:hypothetical protein
MTPSTHHPAGTGNLRVPDGLQQLESALRANARGIYTTEAAVELLIAHRTWLRRADFTGRFLETDTGIVDNTPMAFIDWPAAITALDAGRLPASSSETQILHLAASLADGIPADLRTALNGLDAANNALIVQAVRHAGGNRRPPESAQP